MTTKGKNLMPVNINRVQSERTAENTVVTMVSLVDIAIDSGDEEIMQRLLLALGGMELDGSLSEDERDVASAEADRLAAWMRAKR